MTDESGWMPRQLGLVAKSEILNPGPQSPLAAFHRRMVDLVCRSCGERLGMVTDESDGPWVVLWYPTVVPRSSTKGEPGWTPVASPLPVDGPEIGTHCFSHGDGMVSIAALMDQVERYRDRGKTSRFVVNPIENAHPPS